MDVALGLITELQGQPDKIRNVCVLAHIDHGKTTLSDHLIASNGLIHPRLAGELRYLDSKEEEQARGITMKSSSISLLYVPGAATCPGGPNSIPAEDKIAKGYLINLIDSPGHVDFCSEVSTAARLSDGAFVLVDAVEGVCIQTHAVLRQAWEEKVKLCLVLNKIDRLILELCLTPEEAYERMVAIIAHVNMVISSFKSEQFITEADSVLAYEDAKLHSSKAHGKNTDDNEEQDEVKRGKEEEEEEEGDEFSPAKGNVAFASAHDGWGFRIHQFAEMYATKIGCNASLLQKAMWGEYAFQAKTKRIVKIRAQDRGNAKPLFVQFALEPIWKAYSACDHGADHCTILGNISKGLGLSEGTLKASQHTDARIALRAVLRSWLPLSEAVLGMAREHLPDPISAAPVRYTRLLPSRRDALKGFEQSVEVEEELDTMEKAVAACDGSAEAPVVVYVSKMVAVPANALPKVPGDPPLRDPTEERFLAFGRVFSGVVRTGCPLYVLPAIYNPADPKQEPAQCVTVSALYLMMGRGLERLPHVAAGNVLALGGFDTAVLKSATLASTPLCRPLAPLLFQSAPIVRVAVEPSHPADMPALTQGLRLLHRADPLVQVTIAESGEYVLCAAGEVHLEVCVKDLRERFAKIDLLVSPPLVAFRETIVGHEEEDQHQYYQESHSKENSKEKAPTLSTAQHVVEVTTPGGACTLRARAIALPAALAAAFDTHSSALKSAFGRSHRKSGGNENENEIDDAATYLPQRDAIGNNVDDDGEHRSISSSGASLLDISKQIKSILKTSSMEHGYDAHLMNGILERVWMLGPRMHGPNFLLTPLSSTSSSSTASAADDLGARNSDNDNAIILSNASIISSTTDRDALYRNSAGGYASHPSSSLWNIPQNMVVTVARQSTMHGRAGHMQSSHENSSTLDDTHASPHMHAFSQESSTMHSAGHSEEAVISIPCPFGKATVSDTLLLHVEKENSESGNSERGDFKNDPVATLSALLSASVRVHGENDENVAASTTTTNTTSIEGGSNDGEHEYDDTLQYIYHSIESGIASGFQMASAAGPLCDEPLWAVAFEIEAKLNIHVPSMASRDADRASQHALLIDALKSGLQEEIYGPFSGQITSAVRHALRKAVLEAGPRLAEASFLCEISTSSEGLSAVYAVLGRRRARVLREEMREGSDLFTIHAYLPAETSFGFAEELRRRSSGAAAASLMFSHWERLQVDPFFIPVTEEEREEFGEEGQGVGAPNLAKRLIDSVRKRKGLAVEQKVVESATRQRTLARKV